ncbi:MAG: helix-turn-helix transcriptional regulator [Gammaproteobacteria bacterium]
MNKIIRMQEVTNRTGLKKSSVYDHIATGTFPKPVKLGPRAVGFVESEIDAWLAEKISARDAV